MGRGVRVSVDRCLGEKLQGTGLEKGKMRVRHLQESRTFTGCFTLPGMHISLVFTATLREVPLSPFYR